MKKHLPKLFLTISILLWLVSLSQRAYCTNNDCGEKWSGLAIVISGIFGIFNFGATISWYANPFIFISWLTYKKYKVSLIFSLLALIFGLSFLTFEEIIINEGGFMGDITGYATGFYLWNLSFTIMIIANILNLTNKKL